MLKKYPIVVKTHQCCLVAETERRQWNETIAETNQRLLFPVTRGVSQVHLHIYKKAAVQITEATPLSRNEPPLSAK